MENNAMHFLIISLIITLVIEVIMRKKYKIGFFAYSTVNHAHKWIERILFILFLIAVSIGAVMYSTHGSFLALYIYLTILVFIRSYMEYKKV